MMGTVSLQADPAPSPTPPSCMDVLHKCDSALQAQVQVNNLQKQIIADQEARFNAEHKELEAESLWKPLALGAGAVVLIETVLLILTHK